MICFISPACYTQVVGHPSLLLMLYFTLCREERLLEGMTREHNLHTMFQLPKTTAKISPRIISTNPINKPIKVAVHAVMVSFYNIHNIEVVMKYL